MVDYVISESKKVFSKALKRYAKNDKMENRDISLRLYLKEEDGEVGYTICHEGVFIKDITILNILDIKYQIMDTKGYSLIVPPYLKGFLEGFNEEFGSKKMEIFIFFDIKDDDEIRFFLYNDEEIVKEVYLEDLIKIE
jgi:hypothetical protein